MYPVGKPLDDQPNILVDFVRSGHDESFVGARSEPYLISADSKSIEQVSYATGAHHHWRMDAAARREPIEAPHAYLFYLMNNTRTYRVYEQSVIAALPEGRAQLHAGDDFYYYRPILAGDTLMVEATILPVVRKSGRHGELTFFSDEWKMYNQNNELAAVLVRRAAAISFTKSAELTAGTGDRLPLPTADVVVGKWWRGGTLGECFAKDDLTHLSAHGPLSWMQMMGWLAAVDEYSPTHYDPGFAAAHRYGNGSSIVAGPQLAALMVSSLEGSLGPRWWIRSYENVQRRPVYPNESLTSFSRVTDVSADGVRIALWLVDDEGVVRGTGNAIVAAADDNRKVGM